MYDKECRIENVGIPPKKKMKKGKMWVWHGHFHRKCDHQGSHMVRSMPKEGGDLSYICYVAVAQLVRPKEKEKKDNLTPSGGYQKKKKNNYYCV